MKHNKHADIYMSTSQIKSIKESVHYNIVTNYYSSENKMNSISILGKNTIELAVPIMQSDSPFASENSIDSPLNQPICISYTKAKINSRELDNKEEHNYLVLQFDLTYLENLAKVSPLLLNPLLGNVKKGVPFKLTGKQAYLDQEFIELIEEIKTIISRPHILYTLLNAYVRSLLLKSIHLITFNKSVGPQQYDLSFNKGKQLILKNLNKYPGQKKIQKAACMNRNYFIKTFKHKLGMNPQKYQIQKRREKAITTILNSNASLISISNELGYTHPPALTRDIKKETGMSPQQLRDFYNKALLYKQNLK